MKASKGKLELDIKRKCGTLNLVVNPTVKWIVETEYFRCDGCYLMAMLFGIAISVI